MNFNPYALARLAITGCFVLSIIALFVDPQPAWLSASLGWGTCIWYENMRRQIFSFLIYLKDQGIIEMKEDEPNVPPAI